MILTRLGIDHTDDEETTTPAVRTHIANLHQQATAARKAEQPAASSVARPADNRRALVHRREG